MLFRSEGVYGTSGFGYRNTPTPGNPFIAGERFTVAGDQARTSDYSHGTGMLGVTSGIRDGLDQHGIAFASGMVVAKTGGSDTQSHGPFHDYVYWYTANKALVDAGAKVIRDETRSRAPKAAQSLGPKQPPPGTLKRSVIMKYIRELSGGGRQTFYVLVRHGKKYRNQGKRGNLSQDAWYWRFLEFGTRKMAALPFLRPALESRRREAVDAIKQRLSERIEIEAKALNGR